MRAIDFFCGGGGITRGLLNAGIQVLAGVDICGEYKQTYEHNNHNRFLAKSITAISREDILELIPDIFEANDVLFAGCAPCQPFSQQRNSPEEHKDRNLLSEFGRIIAEYHPAYVLVENVPGIKGKGHDIFEAFLQKLQSNGYQYEYSILNAKNFGVPQNRKRLVLIASRVTSVIMPTITHDGTQEHPYRTVADAIGGFPHIEAGQSFEGLPNHKAASLSELNLRRIRATAHDGGSRTEWPEDLTLECHKAKGAGHTDVYGRMAWNAVSPTLTSKCCSLSNGRFGHPEQDRAISFREAAALQSFPNDYIFYGSSEAVIGREIGNAVPVMLAQAIGYALIQMENQYQDNGE